MTHDDFKQTKIKIGRELFIEAVLQLKGIPERASHKSIGREQTYLFVFLHS